MAGREVCWGGGGEMALLLGLLVLVYPTAARAEAEAVLAAATRLDEDLLARLDVYEEAVLACLGLG